LNNSFVAESFDDFWMLTAADAIDAQAIEGLLRTLKELCEKGVPLIFVDLGQSLQMPATVIASMATGVSALKARFRVEMVVLCEEALAAVLAQSPLVKHLELFKRTEDSAEKYTLTANALNANIAQLHARLLATVENAIQAGVSRWTGQRAMSIEAVSAMVNPAQDVVSKVSMTVDGCEFQVYLSSPQSTLQKMVAQVLNEKIAISDPAIVDGACELLNYLTSYFRQALSSQESVVEMSAPLLLQPDEMMAILEQNLEAQRVQTHNGQFDVWIEAG
jgi:hypothetical protein